MLSLQTFHPILLIIIIIIYLDIKYFPSIPGYENVESNYVVLGSNLAFSVLIQWHYMFYFPVNLLPNFVTKGVNGSACNHWS